MKKEYPMFNLRGDVDGDGAVLDFTVSPAKQPTRMEQFSGWNGVTVPDDNASPSALRASAEAALRFLAKRARLGDGKALWELADIANELCEGLSNMTRTNPSVMKAVARDRGRWPMMRSTHPLMCDPDAWLTEMELGKNVPIEIDKFSKWKPDQAADVAGQLFRYLTEARRKNINFIFGKKKIKAQTLLPEFNRDSAVVWWHYAKQLLLISYPEPEADSKLALISTTPSRTSPGRKREQILTKIKGRFLHMATA